MESFGPAGLEDRIAAQGTAQLILEVAKAASHLELAQALEALIRALKPILRFEAIAVSVIDGDAVRLHTLHVEDIVRKNHQSNGPPNMLRRRPLHEHHVGFVRMSGEPYVCSDLEQQKQFAEDDFLLEKGVRSYVSLPLVRQDEFIGAVDFVSFQKRVFEGSELQLLQDLSEIVSIAVSNALAYEKINALKELLQAENRVLQDEIVQRSIYEEIVGSSVALQNVLRAIERVAPTDSTVLITGETGTGKELIAHALHRRSQRSGRALVKVNCAALPSELIASELFGHEKGAFTGALQQRIGRFETAHGGTIFLDEIGELTPEMQIALLRVLQEKEFERVGGNRTIQADVRVITATNRDLQKEVSEGRFRSDLYYRLNVFPIHMPSLRDRSDDIPILADYFISRFANRMGKQIRRIDRSSSDALQQYAWPGNIRELQNVIERGVILADSDVFRLEPGTLPVAEAAPKNRNNQKAEIEAVLKETRGRISGADGAAARLGIAASTLESRIRALKINKHAFRA
jgi:formate hydrogenlyase transcriptional activator